MKYNKRIVRRTLIDADIEINQMILEERRFLTWLKENYPTARREYDLFRLAKAIGFETELQTA